jgi:hypothetical protein
MESNEKWYSVKEFAASFGMTPGTEHSDNMSVDSVRRWIRRGLIKAFRFPVRSKRIKRSYEKFLISESERQRFIRSRMTS